MNLSKEVVKREDKNRMTAYNMGTVLGPNLIYRKVTDPLKIKFDLERGNALIGIMIEYYSFIFEVNQLDSFSFSSHSFFLSSHKKTKTAKRNRILRQM